jgi:hypothetical protein
MWRDRLPLSEVCAVVLAANGYVHLDLAAVDI